MRTRTRPKSMIIILLFVIAGFSVIIYNVAASKDSSSSSNSMGSGEITADPDFSNKSELPPDHIAYMEHVQELQQTYGGPPENPKQLMSLEGIQTDSDIIPDDYLEATIRVEVGKLTGPLEIADLGKVSDLTLTGVKDITGIENCTNLTYLDANECTEAYVSDMGDLVDSRNLNRITDISALLENPGLGKGDTIDLRNNPLTEVSENEYAPILREKGVEVLITKSNRGVMRNSFSGLLFAKSYILGNDKSNHPSVVDISFPRTWLDTQPQINEDEETVELFVTRERIMELDIDEDTDTIRLLLIESAFSSNLTE